MTDVPLKIHFEQRLHDLEVRLSEQREDLKDRLSGMNEFRESLRDQSATMVTRSELQAVKVSLESKIDSQREVLTQSRIQVAGLAVVVSLVVSLITAVVATAFRGLM